MAIKRKFEPSHVGGFLKRSILPDDLSVTGAVEVLGIGPARPLAAPERQGRPVA